MNESNPIFGAAVDALVRNTDALITGDADGTLTVPGAHLLDLSDGLPDQLMSGSLVSGTPAVAPDVHSGIVELERARMLPEVVAGHPVVCAPGSILYFMDEDGRLMRIVANEAGALSKEPCA